MVWFLITFRRFLAVKLFLVMEWRHMTNWMITRSVYISIYHCYIMEWLLCILFQKNKGLVKTNIPEARHQLKQVKGNLVEFPLDFLEDTDMTIYIRRLLDPSFLNDLFFVAWVQRNYHLKTFFIAKQTCFFFSFFHFH